MLDYLKPCPSDIILDVGCGPGEQLINLSPTIKYGYGIDLSDEMIKVAKERSQNCRNLSFQISSADALPTGFYSSGITKIYSNYALHHLSDDLKFKSIDSFSKILLPGGIFVLGDLMFSENPAAFPDLFYYAGYGPKDDTPATVKDLEAMFRRAGLQPTVRLLTPISGIVIGKKLQ